MFKKGDIVERINSSHYGQVVGSRGVIHSRDGMRLRLECDPSVMHNANNYKLVEKEMTQYERDVEEVKQKREELTKAMDLVMNYNIRLHKDESFWSLYGRDSYAKGRVDILKWAIPDPKTPKQSELERIESEMRKLSDDLAKLKG